MRLGSLASVSKDMDMTEAEHPIIGVVDNDDDVRASIQFLLEVAGHAVETFASAGDLLNAEPRRFACLVLDHHMPRMTGLELAERLRADGVAIPILLITGIPSPMIIARAAELGIDRVLEKPFDEEDLLGFVNAHRS
jgi:two-component system, LuxR family, response regulator FixJ